MTTGNPNSPDPKLTDPNLDPPVESKEIDEFFQRLPGNFRWPKPNAEAVAAAVEAIHRMSGGAAAADDLAAAGATNESGNACSGCGGSLPAGARFCVWCGIPTAPADGDAAAAPAAPRPGVGQHHFHHHYHHIVPGPAASGPRSAPLASSDPFVDSESAAPRGRAPAAGSAKTSSTASPGGRAEVGARQVLQDWAQACNTKHIDDLIELYTADATVIRSSVPPVRSLPAIREFLISLLDAGLGDVEMESLRLEIMGEIAIDLGRCKMLVPVAMGKRREERGKYLVVLVKQPAGTWKILADCWSSDMAVAAPSSESAARKSDPIPPRKPR